MSEAAIWQADCFFAERGEDGRTYEKSQTIHYVAPATDVAAAVAEAVAWIENRQKQLPDWFGTLLALKVYAFTPSAINPDGSYNSPTGFWHYEWKCDQGKVLPRRPEVIDRRADDRKDA